MRHARSGIVVSVRTGEEELDVRRLALLLLGSALLRRHGGRSVDEAGHRGRAARGVGGARPSRRASTLTRQAPGEAVAASDDPTRATRDCGPVRLPAPHDPPRR